MHNFTSDNWTDSDSEAAKIRLAKMDNHAMAKFIEAPEYMCTPAASWNKQPRQCFRVRRELALEERALRTA
jgi:hypothetical protein